ncbi:hypothetical protein GYMLUDRAFT_647497 [Collybiopsis luxurians FD-317 M1]|nr:hypothetical protein GYMLUDRAFT_647497 [Collybiopsis luxurians FD-317 M1]
MCRWILSLIELPSPPPIRNDLFLPSFVHRHCEAMLELRNKTFTFTFKAPKPSYESINLSFFFFIPIFTALFSRIPRTSTHSLTHLYLNLLIVVRGAITFNTSLHWGGEGYVLIRGDHTISITAVVIHSLNDMICSLRLRLSQSTPLRHWPLVGSLTKECRYRYRRPLGWLRLGYTLGIDLIHFTGPCHFLTYSTASLAVSFVRLT